MYLTSDDSDGQQDINKIQVNKAKCFLKLLSSKDVILYMHLLLEVCELLKKLSATQQDKTAAVSDIHRILHSTLAVLKKILFHHRSMSQGNHVRYACAPWRSVAC